MNNHSWEQMDLPFLGNKPLGYKWILKRKMKVNGNIDKYKARLVKVFRQQEDVDYFDTYSHMLRITSIWTSIVITSINKL
jgi:hypothetical protein